MNMVMFRRALYDLRSSVLSYAMAMVFYSLMVLALYPTIHQNAALMNQYLKALPATVMRAFGISNIGTLPGFVGGEYLNIIWPLIAAVFVVMSAAAVVAQEVERGTIELWLSVPVSRASLLTAKLVALLVAIAVLALVTVVTLAVGTDVLGEHVSLGAWIGVGSMLVAFTVAVGGYTALFSAFANERARPAGWAAGVTLLFYMASLLAGASDRWGWLGHFTIFSAYQPQRAMEQGYASAVNIIALLVLGFLCATGAVLIFQRRDAIG